jgi:acetylornithine deacetylase/succinyl-diaminopimelate desuccinylase-like protein
MKDYSKIDAYLEQHLEQSIEELSTLVAQPSVSAQNLGIQECAALVASMLRKRGFETQILPTGGSPVVFAERAGRSDKTMLIYDHYDVQPPEPLELWDTPPFEPSLRDGRLYGRGVSDNKGEIAGRLFAIDALLATDGELPCNIKFIIEGEEETSSVHLHDFVIQHQELLAADACIWEFGGVDHWDKPMQYLGLRGICYVELSVESLSNDAHSGLGGSIFPNAAWRLVWALNSLKGPDGKIRIPGFYDTVLPPSARQIELLSALPDTAEEYRKSYGVKKFLKDLEGGLELNIAEVFDPTCTICGLTAGYQGPGSKTVLPARASAKIDFRLVPNQTPEQVLEQLRSHLDAEGFDDIQITYMGGEPPALTDPDDPFVELVVRTAEPVYGAPMQVVPLIGGSGPNYLFVNVLGLPVVSAGSGYPGALVHAPNEHMRLDLYMKSVKHMTRLLSEFGQV